MTTEVIVNALISGTLSAVGLYLGMNLALNRVINKVDKRVRDSPITKRFEDLVKATEKVTGDNQAVDEITKFFREARELAKSEETKNLLRTLTELVKEMSSTTEKLEIKLPEVKKDNDR